MARGNYLDKFGNFSSFVKFSNYDFTEALVEIIGEEDYLINWSLDRLKGRFINKATETMDFNRFTDENFTFDAFEEAVSTAAFLSKRRIIALVDINFTNLAKDIERVEEIVNTSSGNTLVLMLFYSNKVEKIKDKSIKFSGKSFYFGKLSYGELNSFVNKQIAAHNASIDSKTMKYLIDATGYFYKESDYTLFNMLGDVDKIGAYCSNGAITSEAVDEIILGDRESFIFSFTDRLTENRKDLALEIFQNMMSKGEDPFRLLSFIISQFELAYSTKQLMNEGVNYKQAAKFLKVAEFRIQKLLKLINRKSYGDLKKILLSAYKVEENVKSGLLPIQLAMELFIMSI